MGYVARNTEMGGGLARSDYRSTAAEDRPIIYSQ